jgi:hypothetical protein
MASVLVMRVIRCKDSSRLFDTSTVGRGFAYKLMGGPDFMGKLETLWAR